MADTPSSEASVYFDAESIDMGLFSKNHDSPKPQTSAIGGQNEAARTGTSTFDEPSPSRTYATSPSQPSNNPQPTSMFFNMEPQTAGAEPVPQSHPSPTPARNNYGDDRDRTPTFPQPQPSAATYGDRRGTAHGPSYLSSSTAEGDGGATASDSGYGSTASPQRRTKSLSRTTGVGEETSGLATRNNIPPPVSESSGPQVGRGDGGVGRQQQQQRVGGDAESIKAIPVVWSDGGEGNDQNYADGGMNQSGSTNAMRQRSVRSQRSVGGAGAGIGRNNSMRSFRSNRGGGDQESLSGRQTPGVNSVGGRQRRASLSGGTFAAGAGMIGPDAEVEDTEETFGERRATAETKLDDKEKLRLTKAEVKENKRLVQVIKSEGKAEERALEMSIKELADIQKLQKAAIKEEARTHAQHTYAHRTFHKQELEFFAARAKYEKAQADLKAFEDAIEASRQHAVDATEMLQEKNREVEWLRAQKATHNRERQVKLKGMAGKV